MKRYPVGKVLALASAFGMSSAVALADSISPSTFSATLGLGESTTIRKTVTVDAGPATAVRADVFFLADSTGSMGGPIGAVKTAASSILTSISALGDVHFGVGDYKDFGDSYVYKEANDLTATHAVSLGSISAWTATGGGDTPEANLFALTHVATDTSWRAGSERLVVWFGDARGHDPSGGATLASTISALTSAGIGVIAIDVGAMNGTGQASAIAMVTGGAFYSGISTGTIVSTITSAITTSFSTYSVVGLDTSEAPAGVSVTYVPGGYVGAYDRSVTRTFDFDVTFTGTAAGTYDFAIYGTVDGGRVATETDHIVVGVPDGGSALILLGISFCSLGLLRRRFGKV